MGLDGALVPCGSGVGGVLLCESVVTDAPVDGGCGDQSALVGNIIVKQVP